MTSGLVINDMPLRGHVVAVWEAGGGAGRVETLAE